MKKLSLGIDIGTSKICATIFEMDTQRIKCLTLFRDNVTFPTMIGIPQSHPEALVMFPDLVERPLESEYTVIDSTKRCVICEWSYQMRIARILIDECVNPRNYPNKDWCKEGRQQFTIGNFEWKPQDLFIQLLIQAIKLIDVALQEEYKEKDYAISEIKVGVPMIFHRGEIYVQWLASKVKDVFNISLGHILEKTALIDIVQEPIATLMAYSYARSCLPQGHFIVIDSGAGTTDVVLCEKKGNKISFIDYASWNIAGDNYDIAMEKIIEETIRENDIKVPQKMQVGKKYAKEFKEYYCKTETAPSLSLAGLKPVTIPIDRIKQAFAVLNSNIATKIKTFISKHYKGDIKIRKFYLSGGCTNIKSLIDEIQKSCGISLKDVLKLNIEDPDISKYDSMVVGVSVGAAIPKDKYVDVMTYRLPIDIQIEEVASSVNIGERFTLLKNLYKVNQEENSSRVDLKKIQPNTILLFRIITPNGDRRELKRIHVARYYEERKKRKDLVLTIKCLVDYNGKLTISASSNHISGEKQIYNDFILC